MSATIKRAAILVILTLGTFGNSLFNGFCGDDHAIIVNNTFYSTWQNLPRLFSKGYTTRPELLDRGPGRDYGSGSVAYRPVLSLTYFIDHALWGEKAFGYHLTSLLLHLVNVLLVFWLFSLFFEPGVAFFSAMLFAVHPLQTEAVCAIGYRADLMAAFFVLSGAIAWIRFRQSGEHCWGWVTLAAYVLALFSKENALLLPVALWAYDRLWEKQQGVKAGDAWRWGLIFIAAALFYLVVYVFVFPNPSLYARPAFGNTLMQHLSVVLQVWEFNVYSLFVPVSVAILPPLYSFPPQNVLSLDTAVAVMAMVAAGIFLVRYCQQNEKKLIFFLVWFGVFYIPVSAILATPNPLAYRFLYLPGIGFYAIAGYFFCRLLSLGEARAKWFPGRWLKILAIGVLCIFTFFNNFFWKNNFANAGQWVKSYPGYYKGYLVLGREYFGQYQFDKSIAMLEPFWQDFKQVDPLGLYCLAEAHYQLGHSARAVFFFNELIEYWPFFADGYFGRGKCALDQDDPDGAAAYFIKAMQIEPKEMYIEYLLNQSRLGRSSAVATVIRLKNMFGPQFAKHQGNK